MDARLCTTHAPQVRFSGCGLFFLGFSCCVWAYDTKFANVSKWLENLYMHVPANSEWCAQILFLQVHAMHRWIEMKFLKQGAPNKPRIRSLLVSAQNGNAISDLHTKASHLQDNHSDHLLVPVWEVSSQIICALHAPKRIKFGHIINCWLEHAYTNFGNSAGPICT